VGRVTEPQGRKLAENFVSFAHAIDAKAVAEGIKTEQQHALLADMGCDLGQGHLLGRPMDSQAAQAMLRSGQPLPLRDREPLHPVSSPP
jgi:EAL domain-containing protein (putative c-di-GMP-specific phosphodiesterase class I)